MSFDWGGLIGGVGQVAGGIFSYLNGQSASGMAEDLYGASQELTDAQVALLKQMVEQSGEQWDYWKKYELPVQQRLSRDYLKTYLPLQRRMALDYRNLQLPLEAQIIGEAQQGIEPVYDTVTGQAAADVAQSFGQARESTNRGLARYGVNPNSARFVDTNRQMDIAQSAATAGNMTNARENERRRVEDTNWARRVQAAGIKRGLSMPSPTSNFSGTASNLQGQALAGYGNAASAYGNLGGIASNLAGQSAYGAGQFFSGLGNLASSLSGLFKEEGGPVRKGERYIVGENGPEEFIAERDGFIIPNQDTLQRMRTAESGAGVSTSSMNSSPDPSVDLMNSGNLSKIMERVYSLLEKQSPFFSNARQSSDPSVQSRREIVIQNTQTQPSGGFMNRMLGLGLRDVPARRNFEVARGLIPAAA